MGDLVLETPEPSMRRREDEHAATRFEDATEFCQRGGVIVEMLEHIQRRHDVEVVGCKWQVREVRVVDVLETSHATELERLIRDVDALGAPQQAELLERQARAA